MLQSSLGQLKLFSVMECFSFGRGRDSADKAIAVVALVKRLRMAVQYLTSSAGLGEMPCPKASCASYRHPSGEKAYAGAHPHQGLCHAQAKKHLRRKGA